MRTSTHQPRPLDGDNLRHRVFYKALEKAKLRAPDDAVVRVIVHHGPSHPGERRYLENQDWLVDRRAL